MGALLVLVSAAAPAPAAAVPRVAHIVVGDGASMLVHGDYAYVLEVTDHRNVLQAYPLARGGHRWTATTVELPATSTMRTAGDTVLVSMDAEQVTGIVHTEAFDAGTGRRLWSSGDGVFGVAADGDVFLESKVTFPMVGIADTPVATPGWGFRRVDGRTGRTLWTVGIPLDCDQQVVVRDPAHGLPEGLFELCSTAGELRVIDLANGTERAVRHISTGGNVPVFPPPPASAPLAPQAMVFGSVVIVLHAQDSTARIDGYDISDLSPAWTGIPFAPWQMVTDCGSYLCLLSRSGNAVIDPQTGQSMPGLHPPEAPVPPERAAFVIAPDGVPASLATISQVESIHDGVAVLIPTPVAEDSWIDRLATGPVTTVTPIAKLTDVGASACMQIDGYLACSTALNTVTIWRLPG